MNDALEKLNQAYKKEREVRDFAMLRMPHEVCGITIRPMQLRDYITLNVIGNPFVAGGYRRKVDAAQFIWLLHPTYLAPASGMLNRMRSRVRRAKVCHQIGKLEYTDLARGIDGYLDEMFMDSPGGKDDNKPPTISFAASIIHAFRSTFTREQIMEMPLPELWQYIRCMSDGVTFNRFSDRAKSEYLRSLEGINNG